MSNELIKANLDEILNKMFDNLTLSEKGSLAFDIHNLKARLEDFLKQITEKENELYDCIAREVPYELDEEGKILNTQILNKDTGEMISILEWKQDKKEMLDEEKALETINATMNAEFTAEIFCERKPKTKATLEKELKNYGLSSEAIKDCFSKIERKEPKIVIKKLK